MRPWIFVRGCVPWSVRWSIGNAFGKKIGKENIYSTEIVAQLIKDALDASPYFYKIMCPSVRPSVRQSMGPLVSRLYFCEKPHDKTFTKVMIIRDGLDASSYLCKRVWPSVSCLVQGQQPYNSVRGCVPWSVHQSVSHWVLNAYHCLRMRRWTGVA